MITEPIDQPTKETKTEMPRDVLRETPAKLARAMVIEKKQAMALHKTQLPDAPPSETIFDKAKDFLDTIVVNEKSVDATFTFGVSVSDIQSEAMKKMDDHLKVIIASTTKTLQKIDLKTATWKDITSIVEQNPTVEPYAEPVYRTDKMTKNEKSFSITDRGPNQATVKEVEAWFRNLVNDEDILAQTQIDIDFLAKVVAATGIAIRSFINYLGGAEFIERTLIDVGIIRYPDFEHPYFKVYRISLTAWQNSTKILGFNTNDTGISGEFAMRRYKPRETILQQMRKEILDLAVKEAEDLFL